LGGVEEEVTRAAEDVAGGTDPTEVSLDAVKVNRDPDDEV
jgi:hypothetical protein